jgi:hypothetical protein
MKTLTIPLVLIIVLLFWCSAAARDKKVTLRWMPSDDIHEKTFVNVKALAELNVKIPAVIDKRSEKEIIGKNIEDSKDKLYVTDSDIAEWATGHVWKILKHFRISSHGKDADMLLQFNLVNFYVTEESIYKGNVSFLVTAKGNDGSVIWEDAVHGDSNRWGRSYSANNYLECICNAFVDAVYALVANKKFITTVNEWAGHLNDSDQEIPATVEQTEPIEPSPEQTDR